MVIVDYSLRVAPTTYIHVSRAEYPDEDSMLTDLEPRMSKIAARRSYPSDAHVHFRVRKTVYNAVTIHSYEYVVGRGVI